MNPPNPFTLIVTFAVVFAVLTGTRVVVSYWLDRRYFDIQDLSARRRNAWERNIQITYYAFVLFAVVIAGILHV